MLALLLYINGFIVFVSVLSKHRDEEVKEWSDGILVKVVSDILDY